MRFTVARLPRAVDEIDFSGVTDATITGPADWVERGVLEIPFDRPLTPGEVEAVTVRLISASEAEAEQRAACADYLTVAAPTTAQNTAQIKLLTRLVLDLADRART